MWNRIAEVGAQPQWCYGKGHCKEDAYDKQKAILAIMKMLPEGDVDME